jgi:hypothetical protein
VPPIVTPHNVVQIAFPETAKTVISSEHSLFHTEKRLQKISANRQWRCTSVLYVRTHFTDESYKKDQIHTIPRDLRTIAWALNPVRSTSHS